MTRSWSAKDEYRKEERITHQFYKKTPQTWFEKFAHLVRYVIDKYGRQHAMMIGPIHVKSTSLVQTKNGPKMVSVGDGPYRKERRIRRSNMRRFLRFAARRGYAENEAHLLFDDYKKRKAID